MKTELKTNLNRRMSRIGGQVAGIERMIESGRPCNEILQQVTAVRSAMDQIGVLLLSEHLQSCVLGIDVDSEDECCAVVPKTEQSQQIRDALTRFLR